MKKTLLATLLILTFATAQSTEICGPQVDSFAFVIDASGSMMQTFEDAKDKAGIADESAINDEKISATAKAFVEKVADVIGKDKMVSSLYAVAPFAELAPLSERTGIDYKNITKAKFNANMEVFGRPTWVGERANQHFNQSVVGKNTVVFITDGGFTKELNDPVQALEAYRKANPDTRFYIISAAYTEEGKAQVEALNGQTFMPVVSLETLMTNAKAFKDFVAAAIYNPCDESIELKGVNFAFDKSNLDQKSLDILAQALKVVQARPLSEKMIIQGWTDWTGSDAYNLGLSQRRAQAVKSYLVNHGIAADRITISGKGKSFKYNNHTAEGRYANRRAEIIFID